MDKVEWFREMWRGMTWKERESIMQNLISDYGEQFMNTLDKMWRRYCDEKKLKLEQRIK